jgi:hypothetical protein
MSCVGQRPVVRPWRRAWAGGGGQIQGGKPVRQCVPGTDVPTCSSLPPPWCFCAVRWGEVGLPPHCAAALVTDAAHTPRPQWPALGVLVLERGGGGSDHVGMAKWATNRIRNRQARGGHALPRSKAGSCEIYALRGLSRVGTTPIRSGACRRYILLKFSKKGRCGGARAMYRVQSEEAEEFYGCHCLGRSLQDSAHQLVQLLWLPPLHRQLTTEVHKTSSPWRDGRRLERAIRLCSLRL